MAILDSVLLLSLVGLAVSLSLCAYRAFVGPTVSDRVVAIDTGAAIIVAMMIVGSMYMRSSQYLAYPLVLGVLSFVSTVAFAKYIERGIVFERD